MRARIHDKVAPRAPVAPLATALLFPALGIAAVMLGVTITPNPSTSPLRPAYTNGYTANFTVQNPTTSTKTYDLSCGGSSNVTCVGSPSPSSVTLGAGLSTTASLTYNVGAGGSGWVQLCADGGGVGCGTQTVPIMSANVTPDAGTAPQRAPNTGGYHETFTIKNTGITSMTYTLSCTGSANVTCTGVSRGSVTLAGGAQDTASANYNVGAAGTGTLTLTAASGSDSDPGSYNIPVGTYSVAVTPDSGETAARRPNASNFGEWFTVTNTGTNSDTYNFTCAGSANVSCVNQQYPFGDNPSPRSATLAAGASISVNASYATGAAAVGQLSLAAASTIASNQGSYAIRVTLKTVDVTPVNTWTRGAFVGLSYTASFTVWNVDAASHKYALGCYGSTGVTCPTGPLPDSVYLTAAGTSGDHWTQQVGYSINAGASGNGYIAFTANDHLAEGHLNFGMWPNVAHGVSVTPASGTGPNRGSFTNGYVASFTVRNVGTSSDTYTFTCQAPANVTCGTVSPPSQVLASLDTTVVTVTYNVGATGSAYIGVQASNANANNTGRWNFSVVPSVGYAVAVTPDAKGVGVLVNASASYPFTVRNIGTAQNTYTITATCSGTAIVSGCTPSITSATVPAGGTTAVSVSYTSGGASTTGKITLTAKQTNDIAVKDTGWVNVATGTAQAPVVNVAGVNPGVTPERDLCLTVALSGGAATECGDLRLAHGLPAVRTMGRARAPRLVYSSAHAHPYPLVAAEVTLPAGAANPDSVEAVLKLNGVEKRRVRWAGSAFSPGRANRITIGYDAPNDSTGVYSYTLDVTNIYPGSSLGASPAGSGEFILVNRSQSEFGAGWWLAGLERLRLDSMLWIGGDGSARVYRSAGSNIWFAAAVDRPDTLKKVGTEYVRLLPAKAEVWFDAQGRHVRTVSRLKHDTTWFHRNVGSGKLDSITVAPASQQVRYKFVYNLSSGVLDSVIAPPAGTVPRATKLTKSGAQVTAIRDPDTSSVSFVYDAAYTNRVKSRTDRVGTAASYFFDAAGKVIRDSLDPGLSQPVIVARFRPLESVGFIGTPSPDTADAYGRIDGPRTDVGDSTLFWLDRFGAPRRIRNALSQETLLTRGNGTFLALVTRVQAPNGRVTTATYDARGHVQTTTDSGAVAVTGQPAVTRYAWDASWDAVTLIVPPERDSTVIGIDAATGHRVSQQDAGGNRADFTYYAATGLLATAKEPGATAVTTVNYDVRGNLRSTVSPLGIRDSVARDALGRDTLDVTPIDTTTTPRLYRFASSWYNLADRVIQTQTRGPAVQYTLSSAPRDTTTITADALTVQNAYDREGRLTDVTTATQTTTVDEHRTYDGAGRLLTKRLGSGPTTFTYDAAGNALTQSYRYGVVTTTYDELNRVVRRVVPRRAFPHTDCLGHPTGPLTGAGTDCLISVPLYPNLAGDSVEVPADTSVFGYDVAGNPVQADNRYAQVHRSFFPNGLLQRDTLRMRDYLDGAYGHVYALRYGYDGDGRRTRLFLPGGGDSLTYAYSPTNGALAQVSDPAGHRYALTYTPAGRLDSLKVFNTVSATIPGVKEHRQYDADGRLVWRERRTGASALLQLDSLRLDLQGRVAQAATQSAALDHQGERTTTAYAGLGAVLASERVQTSSGVWEVEEFRPDGMGNVYYNHWRSQADSTSHRPQRSIFDAHGMLSMRRGDVPGICNPQTYTDSLYQVGDALPNAGGNVVRAGELHAVSGCTPYDAGTQSTTNSYYTADNKLAITERHDLRGADHGAWEEYWYDALGRRIMVRSRREWAICTVTTGNECVSFVQRTVWDGDQVLSEERTSGLDAITGGAPNYGTVTYVHVGGIDKPVALLDGRVIHYNWRGLAEASSWTDGSPADHQLGASTVVAWPAGQGVYWRRAADPYAGLTITWIGSLPANGQDGTGQLYRRNRYYDPASGRFTQEDPLGLAGGLNLYGFAGGDPVNFSDPFGLCPPKTLAEVFMCTGQILQPWQRPLEIAGMAVMLPLTITGEAGAITTLGIAGGRAAMVGRAVEAAVEGASELAGPGRQIFEAARIVGTKGLTQSNATEAVAQAVTKLGYETGGMVTREGVNYVLAGEARNGMVNAVGVDASGATTRALFKIGEKGLEFVRDLGSIAAQQ